MIERKVIAIIGGGFCGTITAVNILKHQSKKFKILLIEKKNNIARGLAYGIADENLLLNVPAANMSAIANDQSHFLNYCQKIYPSIQERSFVQRTLYGKYLEETLFSAIKNNEDSIEIINNEVIALHNNADHYKIEFKNKKIQNVDKVILALGNFEKDLRTDIDKKFLIQPWDFAAIEKLDKDKTVAIMGMGHTAIDVLLKLTNKNKTRKVIIFSRRGLLPKSHELDPNPRIPNKNPSYLKNLKPKILSYFQTLRSTIKKYKNDKINWRDILTELRPHTPSIFGLLPENEKKKFLNKIVPYWDIHRHRLPPETNLKLKELFNSKQVDKIAGHLEELIVKEDMLQVKIKLKKTNDIRDFLVDSFIDCSGPDYNLDKITSPLIKQLYKTGQIQPDNLRLGIKINETYQPINSNNHFNNNLYYIGPMLRAKYWEAIAIPELSQHCQHLATNIMNSK